MEKKRLFSVIAAISAVSLALIGCSNANGNETQETDEGGSGVYKLGAPMPLTGDDASLGVDFTKFLEYGVADVNEQYADQGIQLDLLVEDTGSSAERAVQAFNKLASVDEVPVVFTAWSSVVQAMAPVASDLNVAMVNSGANDPLLDGASPYLANFFTLASVEMKRFVDWFYPEHDYQDAAVIYIENATGEGGATQFRASWEEHGGNITAFEGIAPGTTDASSTVTKVLATNPEVVHLHTLPVEGGPLVRELRAQGFDGQITSFGGATVDAAARNVSGESGNGMLYPSVKSYDKTDPRVAEIVERFKADNAGRDPNALNYCTTFYDSAFLYAELVKNLNDEGKEITGENLIEAIRGGTFEVPFQGSVTFDDLTLQGVIEIFRLTDTSQPSSEDESLAVIN